MNGAARGDIKIAGAGTVASGAYRNVNVMGSATLTGDVDCILLKVSGAAEGGGTLKAETVKVNGSLGYRGDAEAQDVRVNGTATFAGLRAEKVDAAGTLDVRGLTANAIRVRGYLNVAEDCEAERFVAHGAFSVGGLLNAGAVDVTLGGSCSAREIGGEAVTVRDGVGSLKRLVAAFVPSLDVRLTAESIEGDEIRLERTSARTVRGNRVEIGQGCDVELVEYADSYTAAPDAKVRRAIKLSDEKPAEGST